MLKLKSVLKTSFGNVKVYHEEYGFIATGTCSDILRQIEQKELMNYTINAMTANVCDNIIYLKIYVGGNK